MKTSNILSINKLDRANRLHKTLKTASFWGHKVYRIALYVLLLDLAFVFLFPFIFMIVTSIKSPNDLNDITVQWIPKAIEWKNYKVAAFALDFKQGLKNSAFVTLICTFGHILSCSFIAYGFSRCKFPGQEFLFKLVLLTMIIPVQVIIFPLYIQYSKVGWINTYLPLTVPTFFGFGLRGGLYIFIFRQFFMGLPYDLEDAARIDGCGSFKTFFRIVLPISKAAMLVSFILSMVWHWNDYFEPNIYLGKPKTFLLPAKLPSMYQMVNNMDSSQMEDLGEIIFNDATLMAGTFLVVLPLLIVYLILQKQFMEGVERTGIVG